MKILIIILICVFIAGSQVAEKMTTKNRVGKFTQTVSIWKDSSTNDTRSYRRQPSLWIPKTKCTGKRHSGPLFAPDRSLGSCSSEFLLVFVRLLYGYVSYIISFIKCNCCSRELPEGKWKADECKNVYHLSKWQKLKNEEMAQEGYRLEADPVRS